MNRLNLAFWILLVSFFIMISSCGKNNYDLSEVTTEEIEPTTNYTGEDNLYHFSFVTLTSGTTNTKGGSAVENNISLIEETDLFKWKITSTIQDGGFTVLAETTFYTSDKNGGTFPIAELHLQFTDGGGTEEFTWGIDEIVGEIQVSTLNGTPEFVSGTIGGSADGPAGSETTYSYAAEFFKIPLN